MPMSPSIQEHRSSLLTGHVGAGTLDLVDDPELVKELNQAELVLSGGRWLITAPKRRSAHDDGVDCPLLAAERAQHLRPCAGDIERTGGGIFLGIDGKPTLHPRTWRRRLPDGTFEPCAPPPGTPDAERARAQRFGEGCFTAEDVRDLGEEEVKRRLGIGINIRVQ
jgi:hypothetical protein